ncbi:hypothetical protein Tsubulata_025436 [Turnera subulata]|uniref:Uncharacterized protein n=1 Tax=Turnera subulata TaxID=218843 RepID=A0A9Q0JK22_9ROSI|nr:hypothetical protein Tsubulata_025436 [Turnera subulata]
MSSPSSSSYSSGDHFLRRLWFQLSSHNPVSACIRFFTLRVAPAVNAALSVEAIDREGVDEGELVGEVLGEDGIGNGGDLGVAVGRRRKGGEEEEDRGV